MLDNENLCSSSLHNEREAMEDVFNFRFFLQETSAEFVDPLISVHGQLTLITVGNYCVMCCLFIIRTWERTKGKTISFQKVQLYSNNGLICIVNVRIWYLRKDYRNILVLITSLHIFRFLI